MAYEGRGRGASGNGNGHRAGAETQESKYPPEDFIVPPSNTKGESVRLWFRVQPSYDRQLDVVLNSKKFPCWKTKGDVLRWGLREALRRISRMEEGIPSILHEIDAMNEIIRTQRDRQQFVQMFTDLSEVVHQHLNDGATGEARKVVIIIRRHLDKMEDGYWKKRYLGILEEKFGHIIEQSKGAKLRPVVKDRGKGTTAGRRV